MKVSLATEGNVEIDGTVPDVYPNAKNYSSGTAVVLEAFPAEGFKFAGWSGSLTGNANPATVNMTCSKTITAAFAPKDQFVLTVDVSGGAGRVTPSAGTHSYYEGSTVNITAEPDSHYRFEGWTGDVSDPASANTNVTMDASKTVAAGFSPINHVLTIDITGEGSVSPSAGDHTYLEGSTIRLVATPTAGYEFKGWTGPVQDVTSATTTVTVASNLTIGASFSKIPPNWGLIGGASAGGIVVIGGVAGGAIWLKKRRARV